MRFVAAAVIVAILFLVLAKQGTDPGPVITDGWLTVSKIARYILDQLDQLAT